MLHVLQDAPPLVVADAEQALPHRRERILGRRVQGCVVREGARRRVQRLLACLPPPPFPLASTSICATAP